MQEQLSQASIDNAQVISKLSFVTGKLAGHLLRAREWQRELTNILEEAKDEEVITICGPDLEDLLKNINADKELAVREAREDIKRCVICASKEKNVTLIPCSHTFCDDCVDKMRAAEGSKCAFCRQKIFGSFPIHLTE
ncbi:MAG: RING-HC finger protein [Sedimenticola sp.]